MVTSINDAKMLNRIINCDFKKIMPGILNTWKWFVLYEPFLFYPS